jgi:hypothetical protein
VERLVSFQVPEIWKGENTTKVMARTVMKAVPGKMAELVEPEKKHMAIANRVLGISGRCYRRVSGAGDTMNTIIVEGEFDSFAAFEAHPQKMGADPEMQALLPKYEGIMDSMEVEFSMPMPKE